MKFKDKTVLITGGTRGMGKSHVEAFLQEGATVYFTDILESGREMEKLSKKAHFIKADVASEDDWKNVANIIEEKEGKLDILVNNAGIVNYKPIGIMTLGEYMQVINVNQVSVFLSLTHMHKLLKAGTNASVINISSIAGYKTSPYGIAYSSSKFAVRAMTEVAAQEFAPFKIRVNTICPGAIDTPMIRQGDTKSAVDEFAKSIPLKRVGEPQEITNAVMFLSSNESLYMTGSTMVIDGGSLLV